MRHLRAHVRFAGHYAMGKPVYEFRIINHSTGLVVAQDDHCGWEKLHDEAFDAVYTARHAWMMGLRKRDLKG